MIIRGANAWTAQYHDRMPCLLPRQDFAAWLDGSGGMEPLKQPPCALRERIVSKCVKRAGEGDEDPRTVEPFKDGLF